MFFLFASIMEFNIGENVYVVEIVDKGIIWVHRIHQNC